MKKIQGFVRAVLFLCINIMISMSLSVRTQAKIINNPGDFTADLFIGHRGARDLAPQNTMASFQEALKAGYTMMECDLWYTQSGDILICHQESIKSYTGHKKMIWELSLKNRMKYPIKRGKKVGKHPTQYMPSIDEVLQFASQNNVKMFLHLKKGKTCFKRKALRKLNQAMKKYSFKEKPVVCTSDKSVMHRMAGYDWIRAYVCTDPKKKSVRSAMDFASQNGCTYLFVPCRKKNKPTRPLIRYGHKKGLKMIYFDIRGNKKALRVFRKGVDYVMSDKILFKKK